MRNGKTMFYDKPHHISSLFPLRNMTREAVMTLYGVRPEDVHEDVRYEGLDNLTEIHVPEKHPARFFFRGDRVVLVYIGDESFLSELTPSSIEVILGKKRERLRSRAGRMANHWVYPRLGIAYSEDQGAIAFVELFQPTTMEGYLSIYRPVEPYIL